MNSNPLHVAVGVIRNESGQILISRRHAHLHQGGLWEFPGGKVEEGENVQTALARELREELSIQAGRISPLLRIPYHYPDKHVLLDVWELESFEGEPHGTEDQQIRWAKLEELTQLEFPAANRGIVNALQLPHELLVTGEFSSPQDFLRRLENGLRKGIRLVQARINHLDSETAVSLLQMSTPLLETYNAELIVNAEISVFEQSHTSGYHLRSSMLHEFDSRPVSTECWLSAAVHNLEEIEQAQRLEVDFGLLSPVYRTDTHPDATPLGLDHFAELVAQAPFPVYALGGMGLADINPIRRLGGQGIAAIRGLWQA